jgi:hypothetical protein
VTDFTSAAKVEIKNAHPVDATKYCPVVMNTNENIYVYLNQSRFGKLRYSEEQLEAVRRRLTIVPFTDKFTRLHRIDSMLLMQQYAQPLKDFYDMEKAGPSLFNFFMVFALY